jgi:conjugal transfer pilus assembly protein TraU
LKKASLILLCCLLLAAPPVCGKSGTPFNPLTDIHWGEIDFTVEGPCFCPRPPPVFIETGIIVSYWEPFLLIDTSSIAFYSAMLGESVGGTLTDELGGQEQEFGCGGYRQRIDLRPGPCLSPSSDGPDLQRNDYGSWWSEYDPMWQNDELSFMIHPEAALFANKDMVMACMADATAANIGWPLDFMPWCVGSGGSRLSDDRPC